MNSSEMMVDSKDILNNLDNFPLASHFIDTRKGAKTKSAMSWLGLCDEDTLNMILQYGEKMFKDDEVPVENKKLDIFDLEMIPKREEKENLEAILDGKIIEPKEEEAKRPAFLEMEAEKYGEYEEEEEEEEGILCPVSFPTDSTDFYGLTVLILAWENDEIMVPVEATENAALNLFVYAGMEKARRLGMIKMRGSGTLTSEKTEFISTKNAQSIAKKKLKEWEASEKTKKGKRNEKEKSIRKDR